jgi:CHAD domain-containing protein
MELLEYLKQQTTYSFEIDENDDLVYAGEIFIIIHHFRTKSKVTVYDSENYHSQTCEMTNEKILTTLKKLIKQLGE